MWKDIPGWEDRYQVSADGGIRSKDMPCRAGQGGTAVRKGRELALVVKGGRYLCVTLTSATGARKQCFVHDLVLLAFVGPKPEGLLVRHLDDNNRRNQLSNLAYGTHTENMADKAKHGKMKGVLHPAAKLTASAVRYIRTSPATGRALARAYGVSPSQISSVRNRHSWGHVLI